MSQRGGYSGCSTLCVSHALRVHTGGLVANSETPEPTVPRQRCMSRPSRKSNASTPAEDDLVVDAAAERALFVEMLTRDIELIPAIIDLVDNSIDGARALADEGDLGRSWVRITASKDSFVVEDNCGGIDLDVARHYAFRFGRPEAYKGTRRSVGQFGVGMKRALFKLGEHFTVDSRAETTSFFLEVPVVEWADDNDPIWTFSMSQASRNYDSASGGRGTTITVTELHESISEDLIDGQFLSLLREQIRYRHQKALDEGMDIRLNGDKLAGFERELLSGPAFQPINRTFVASGPEGDVAVRIIAGIVGLAKDEVGRDEGDAENFRNAGDAGWWIFCNDRLLLMRDRTRLTGWGDNFPVYHPQYRQFRGYVWMTAAETAALPWNTTKTGVDEDSRVWRQVQAQVKICGAQVVAIINRIKLESQTATSESDMPTVLASRGAKLTLIEKLPDNSSFTAPPPRKTTGRSPSRKPKVQHMQFDVPLDRFTQVAVQLKSSVVAEVGRRTFDYYYECEIED